MVSYWAEQCQFKNRCNASPRDCASSLGAPYSTYLPLRTLAATPQHLHHALTRYVRRPPHVQKPEREQISTRHASIGARYGSPTIATPLFVPTRRQHGRQSQHRRTPAKEESHADKACTIRMGQEIACKQRSEAEGTWSGKWQHYGFLQKGRRHQ